MKIDLELLTAAIASVFKEHRVATFGAIPLEALKEYWESVRLRRADLAVGIEALCQQGRIELETRRDGLWVRRKGNDAPAHRIYEKLLASVRKRVTGHSMVQIRLRRDDGYSGMDRRMASRGSPHASGATRSGVQASCR